MMAKKKIKVMTATEYRKANPKLFPETKKKKIDEGKVANADENKEVNDKEK